MNKQDLVLEYTDYGFTQKEISKKLDMDLNMVMSALEENELDFYAAKSRIRVHNGNRGGSVHMKDKNVRIFELLYAHGPTKINYKIRKLGMSKASRELNTTLGILYGLKDHFGYHRPLPLDALYRIPYFPCEIRLKINERDLGACIRCHGVKSV